MDDVYENKPLDRAFLDKNWGDFFSLYRASVLEYLGKRYTFNMNRRNTSNT